MEQSLVEISSMACETRQITCSLFLDLAFQGARSVYGEHLGVSTPLWKGPSTNLMSPALVGSRTSVLNSCIVRCYRVPSIIHHTGALSGQRRSFVPNPGNRRGQACETTVIWHHLLAQIFFHSSLPLPKILITIAVDHLSQSSMLS